MSTRSCAFFFPVVIIGLFSIILISCRKTATNTNAQYYNPNTSTYSIKGQILQDCTAMPCSFDTVKLESFGGNYHSHFYFDRGTTITDSEGNFIINNIPAFNYAALHLSVNGKEILSNFAVAEPLRNGIVYDLSTIYRKYVSYSIMKLNIDSAAFTPQDTLYVGKGWYGDSTTALHPIPSSCVLIRSHASGGIVDNALLEPYIWAIGYSNYVALVSAATPSDVTHCFYVKQAACSFPDTTYISIP